MKIIPKVIINNFILVLELIEKIEQNNNSTGVTIILKPKFEKIEENEKESVMFNYYEKIKNLTLNMCINKIDENTIVSNIKKRKLIIIDDMIDNIKKDKTLDNSHINLSLYTELSYLENFYKEIYYCPINSLDKFDNIFNLNTSTKVLIPNRQLVKENSIIEIIENNYLISYETYFEWDNFGIFNPTDDYSYKFYEDVKSNISSRIKTLLCNLTNNDSSDISSISIHLIINFEFDKVEIFNELFSNCKELTNYNKVKLKKFFINNLYESYQKERVQNISEFLFRLLVLKIEYEDFCLILMKDIQKKFNVKLSVINSNINEFIQRVINQYLSFENHLNSNQTITVNNISSNTNLIINDSKEENLINNDKIPDRNNMNNVNKNINGDMVEILHLPNVCDFNLQKESKTDHYLEKDFIPNMKKESQNCKNNANNLDNYDINLIIKRNLLTEFIKYSYNKGCLTIFISNLTFLEKEFKYNQEIINLNFEKDRYTEVSIEKI